MKIIDQVRETIKEYDLISRGDTIIIGASGGPDSQFLIYALNELKDDLGFNIILAHLNHLHRKEAKFDQDLVEKTGDLLGIKTITRARSMDDYAKEMKISPEDAGRRLRYEFFRSILPKYPKGKIAVAHTFDDQAETVLMRIIRGSGIGGLRAMAYKNADIIRPILDIQKDDLIAYLNEKSIAYAIDKTNLATDYRRNKIRLDIIPRIEDLNPNFKKSLVNLSHLAKDERSINEPYVKEIYDKLVKTKDSKAIIFDKDTYESLKDPIKARVIRLAISDLKGEVKDFSKENLDLFLSLSDLSYGKKIIKDDISFMKSYNYYELRLGDIKVDKKVEEIYLGDPLKFDGWSIKATRAKREERSKNKNIAYFDLDKVNFPLRIRYRKAGDKFRPLGMGGHKKLKDFFIDQKIDKNKRSKIPLILSDSSIIWVVGMRMSEDYKVDSTSKNILKIEVLND
ncbi:MAG: tRNA lysidine(34) synthetase TilS [Anaerococcus sp.]|nr:tRNA lysidine(34) synthetase TilS [Anaerococcus sp.]